MVNLHDADRHDRLASDSVNNTYRNDAQQSALYAKGRTAPGDIVTHARAGQSWHNYGVATSCSSSALAIVGSSRPCQQSPT